MSSENDDLAALLAATGQGDPRAFEQLYALTSGIGFARVLRIVQDPELAKDVLQTAYVSIWKNASKFEPRKGQPLAWITTIMRNRALDALRSRARRPVSELIDESIADEGEKAEARAESNLLSRLLEEHLSSLPHDIVTALRLNIVEGWTCQEISDHFNVSRNTVKSRIRRGLIRLRAELPYANLQQLI